MAGKRRRPSTPAARRGNLALMAAQGSEEKLSLTRRSATVESDVRRWISDFFGVLQNPDPLQLDQQSSSSRFRYAFGIYEEKRQKDGHLAGVLSQREGAVTSAPRQWLPADESAEAAHSAAFVDAALKRCAGWENAVNALSQGVYYGLAWVEIVWGWQDIEFENPDAGFQRMEAAAGLAPVPGKLRARALVPLAAIPVHPCRFVFSTERDGLGDYLPRLLTKAHLVDGVPVPPRKFLLHRPHAEFGEPYGTPLGARTWFWAEFKRTDVKDWLVFNEKFASPFVWFKYPRTAEKEEIAAHKRTATSVRSAAAGIGPDDLEPILLEASRGGSLSCYKDLAEFCNTEMSKAVLGQTLTTEAGQRGARSLGEVHKDVRGDILKADALALAQTLETAARWICELNGLGPAPRMEIDVDPPQDAKANLDRFEQAQRMGIALEEDQVRREGNLVKPKDAASALQPPPPPEPAPGSPNPDNQKPSGDATSSPGKGGGKAAAPRALPAPERKSPERLQASCAHAHQTLQELAAQVLAEPQPLIEHSLRSALGSAAARARAHHEQHLSAEAALPPSPGLHSLRRDGVDRCAQLCAQIPGLVIEALREELAARYGDGLNPVDMSRPLDPGLLGWARDWSLPEKLKRALVDQTNDDLTSAALLARAKVGAQREGGSRKAQAANTNPASAAFGARSLLFGGKAPEIKINGAAIAKVIENRLLQAAEGEPQSNPEIKALFGEERLIPSRVTALLSRKGLEGLLSEDFYRLDALARSASFTAWDTAELTVQGIAGAVQDAVQKGWTRQQFADHLWDVLQARYVKQGQELHAWHVETIYDTNLATAWNQAQMDEIWGSREIFPFVQFINPDPQFPVCTAMSGKVWRTDDPAWRAYTPPLHFNCGSSIASLVSAEGFELQQGAPLDETGRPLLPEVYRGPADPFTGQRLGIAAPFGAWAPLDERYEHLRQQKGALGL